MTFYELFQIISVFTYDGVIIILAGDNIELTIVVSIATGLDNGLFFEVREFPRECHHTNDILITTPWTQIFLFSHFPPPTLCRRSNGLEDAPRYACLRAVSTPDKKIL